MSNPALHFDDQHYPEPSADLLQDCKWLCNTGPVCTTPVYDDLGAVCVCGHYADCHEVSA